MKFRATAKADAGQSIDDAADEACRRSNSANLPIVLIFNDTEVIIHPYDVPGAVARDWNALRRQEQRRKALQ